jgi:putative ABC transport system permease protein
MTLLLGAFTIGLILALLALGVFVSFRIFDVPDITTDGSITLGAAIAAVMLNLGYNPLIATMAGAAGGAIAGTITGILHTRFRINALLAGILVMTALYSVNLHVMGRSNIPLMEARTLASVSESVGEAVVGAERFEAFGWRVSSADASVLVFSFLAAAAVGCVMFFFFKTNLGTAMRATGDNPQMIRALGANVERNIVIGLAIANGLVALSGALLAQYQGFADAQMGIGMVVWGLASVIIGEALVGGRSIGLAIVGTIMGSVLFRLLVAIALRWGLNPNDLKLVTALFVFVALVLPRFIGRFGGRKKKPAAA